MSAHRASTLLATAALAALFAPATASAQVQNDVVVNILRECAKIDDPGARLACYDNNIRSAGGSPRQSAPDQGQRPAANAPVANAGTAAGGFGAETIRTPERFQAPAGEAQEIQARVTSVTQREPGIYLLQLEDGAQWLFSEGVNRSYRVPERGSTVEISRASLGSFLLRFNNQAPVRVRRIR